jgi:hypothetical protein
MTGRGAARAIPLCPTPLNRHEPLWPSIGAAGLAILAGWWVTLSPERYVLEALKQLWEVGRFIFLAVKG